MEIINNTGYTEKEIESMPFIGVTINEWRGRHVRLYQAPEEENVISIGTTFDETRRIIAEEPKTDFATALDYIKHGKVYTFK